MKVKSIHPAPGGKSAKAGKISDALSAFNVIITTEQTIALITELATLVTANPGWDISLTAWRYQGRLACTVSKHAPGSATNRRAKKATPAAAEWWDHEGRNEPPGY